MCLIDILYLWACTGGHLRGSNSVARPAAAHPLGSITRDREADHFWHRPRGSQTAGGWAANCSIYRCRWQEIPSRLRGPATELAPLFSAGKPRTGPVLPDLTWIKRFFFSVLHNPARGGL